MAAPLKLTPYHASPYPRIMRARVTSSDNVVRPRSSESKLSTRIRLAPMPCPLSHLLVMHAFSAAGACRNRQQPLDALLHWTANGFATPSNESCFSVKGDLLARLVTPRAKRASLGAIRGDRRRS